MGEPIARRLLGAGHVLSVWNRTTARTAGLAGAGARVLSTPKEAWEAADVCVTMVLDDGALLEITTGADGLLASGGDGRVSLQAATAMTDARRTVDRHR